MMRPATDLPTRKFSAAEVVPEVAATTRFRYERGETAGEPSGATRRFDPTEVLGCIGDYDLVRRLGRRVFLAHHRVTRQELAVRVLDPPPAGRLDLLQRQLAEARALAAIDHPNVGRAIEIGADAGRVYVVMDYLRGTLLDAVLDMYGPPAPAQAIRIGTLVARGLAAAHAHGVVHRALEAGAAMVLPSERGRSTIKLIDFAISERDDVVRIARPSMSPELCRGEAVDHRTDLYSLGVLLHRVCTGRDPFEGTPIELLAMHRFRSVVRPELVLAGIPDGLATAIRRCLAEEPDARYRSADEVIEALRGAAAELGRPEHSEHARPMFLSMDPGADSPAG
ncbi:MAG TPA: serine/threonine-protein kinase, partial [Kofleriaceae bacterium]|nr:serine/threonine-protein kinase [Kofleriaceae bacterium]